MLLPPSAWQEEAVARFEESHGYPPREKQAGLPSQERFNTLISLRYKEA